MKHGFRTMSLRVKMPLLFCSLLFIIISLFGFILYMYYDGTFQQSYKDSFQMAMTTNANGVRETLSELENAINVINDNDNSYIGFSSENISLAANLIINTNPEEKDFDFYDMLMDKKLCEQTTEVLFKSAASYAVIIDDEYPISTYLLNYNKGKSGFFKDATVCDSIWYKKALELDGDMYWFADNEFPDRFFIAKLLKYQIYCNRRSPTATDAVVNGHSAVRQRPA